MRVIVTGSRDWTDHQTISDALSDLIYDEGGRDVSVLITVVHGAARGADSIAAKACETMKLAQETHPADWATHGTAAGPKRNAEMVALGAHLVLAFPIGDRRTSPGTWNTIDLAARAGIRIRIYPWRFL